MCIDWLIQKTNFLGYKKHPVFSEIVAYAEIVAHPRGNWKNSGTRGDSGTCAANYVTFETQVFDPVDNNSDSDDFMVSGEYWMINWLIWWDCVSDPENR